MGLHRMSVLAVLALALGSHGASATSDFRDVALVSATISHVLERERTGVEVSWSNPDTGNAGSVVAERTYYIDGRTPCRDYRRTMRGSGGETLIVRGTGCRTAAGRWRLDEQSDSDVAAAPPPEPEVPYGDSRPAPAVERAPLPGSAVEPSWSAGPEPEPAAPPASEPTADPVDEAPPAATTPRQGPPERAERAVASRSETAMPPLPKRRPGQEPSVAARPSSETSAGSVTVSLPSRSES